MEGELICKTLGTGCPNHLQRYLRCTRYVISRLVLFIIIFTGSTMLFGQNLQWAWVQQVTVTGDCWEDGLSNDPQGNSYVCGSFTGTVTFGNISLVCSGAYNGFVAKLDPNGNWLWAAQTSVGFGGGTYDHLVTDPQGNSYIWGQFGAGTVTFGNHTLTHSGRWWDTYIAKLDTNGNWLWARSAAGYIEPYNLCTDAIGNCYLGLQFSDTINLGPLTITSRYGRSDWGVVKLDANGNWLWVRNAGGGSNDWGGTISTDDQGNSYVTGSFVGTAYFGNLSLVGYSNRYSIGVAKLDTNGNWLWVNSIVPSGSSGDAYSWAIAVSSLGNCYICGESEAPFIIGSNSVTAGYFDAKLDANGNWMWARNVPEWTWLSSCLAAGANDGYYTFCCGSIKKKDSEGNVISETNGYPGQNIAADVNDNCYVVGNLWSNSLSFGSTTLTGPGLYIAKIVSDSQASPQIITYPEAVLDFAEVYLESDPQEHQLWIKNVGTGELSVESFDFHLSDSPYSVTAGQLPITVLPGDSTAVTIVFAPQGTGVVSDSLYIHNNSVSCPTYIIGLSGRGEHAPPKAPTGIAASMEGNDVVISWDAVTETVLDAPITPDYYLVFYSESSEPTGEYLLHGTASNMSYTHQQAGLQHQHMFYRIRAVKQFTEGRTDISVLPVGMPEKHVLAWLREEGK